jgi:hypothetical protein
VAIGEPCSRPQHIHEWKITADSLFSAVALGVTPNEIIKYLSIMSKTELHTDVSNFIKTKAKCAGQLYKVLENGQYYIETTTKHRATLKRLREYLYQQSESLNQQIDVLQSHTKIINDSNKWLSLYYQSTLNNNEYNTGYYGAYPYVYDILRITKSTQQPTAGAGAGALTAMNATSSLSGTLQLHNIHDLKRNDILVLITTIMKKDKDEKNKNNTIPNMTINQEYIVKDVAPHTNTVTLVDMIPYGQKPGTSDGHQVQQIHNSTPNIFFPHDLYKNDLQQYKLKKYNKRLVETHGLRGYNDVRNEMNYRKWANVWKEQHRMKLQEHYGWSTLQSTAEDTQKQKIMNHKKEMWKKTETILSNKGTNGVHLFETLNFDKFMLQEQWRLTNNSIEWRSVQGRTQYLILEERKTKTGGAVRLRKKEPRLSFCKKNTNVIVVASNSTENGRLIQDVMIELNRESSGRMSDVQEYSELIDELLRRHDNVVEEMKNNQKINKKVVENIEEIERKKNFVSVWLREQYDHTMTNNAWKILVDKKMKEKIDQKGSAMLASKSTNQSQWYVVWLCVDGICVNIYL